MRHYCQYDAYCNSGASTLLIRSLRGWLALRDHVLARFRDSLSPLLAVNIYSTSQRRDMKVLFSIYSKLEIVFRTNKLFRKM